MSIQTEIALLQKTKDEIRTAIMEKGVTVYNNDPFSIYPTRIGQISTTAGDRDALFTDILERDITSIEIPEGTSRIDEAIFRYCTQMTSVVIPSTVSFIGYLAFEHCTALTSITCLGTTPATLDGGTFNDTNDCPIYVPEDSVDAYKTAWPQYADRIQAKGATPVTVFKAVTSVDEVTSGKYILGFGYGNVIAADEEDDKALNASLIKDTTSSSDGINGSTNIINVNFTDNETIYPDNLFDYVVFDYDSDAQKIYWTDTNDNNTRYYMFQASIRAEYFGTPTTTVPSTNITVTTNGYNNKFITFTFSGGRVLKDDENSEKIGWYFESSNHYDFTLYKKTEVVPVKKGVFTFSNNTSIDVLDYSGNSSSLAITAWDAAHKYNLTLKTAEMNDKVTLIDAYAFYRCTALESVIIPNSVTEIFTYAFYGCNGLQSVTCLADTPPTLDSDAFLDTGNFAIYVPAASLDAYKAARNWSTYADRLQAIQ